MSGRAGAVADLPLVSDAIVAGLFAPLRMRNAGEQVADRLMTAIALGEFVPGQRLPTERELAASLAVSRTTIREAISRLAATGYVAVRRGRHGGTFVLFDTGPESDEAIRRTLVPGWAQLERLLDLRTLLEPLIARTAAERRSDDDCMLIRDTLAQYRDAGDREASSRADGAFHASVAQATGNPYLVDLSDRIRQAVSLGFRAEPYTPAIRERAIGEHSQLAAAITDGRPDDAARIARRHFALTEDRLREVYRRAQASS